MYMEVIYIRNHTAVVGMCTQAFDFSATLMQNEVGCTALWLACQNGHRDVAAVLIKKGATVDYLNKVRRVYSMIIITVVLMELCA